MNHPHRVGFWSGLLAPLLCVVLGLKTIRVATRGLESGLLALPDLYLSELSLLVAFGLLGHLLLGVAERTRTRTLVLVGLQSCALTLGALELVGHRFYMRTGAAIDYPLLVSALRNFSTNWPIVLSELSGAYATFIGVTLAVLLVGPWMARTLADEHFEPPEQTRPGSPRLLIPAAVVLSALSLAPPLVASDSWFASSSTANVLLSFGAELRDRVGSTPDVSSPAAELAVERRADPPDDPPENVVFVVLESVRASATGVYNNDLETTPFLSSLADRSSLARHAYATVPHTSKALTSILCGIHPRPSIWITESRPGNIPARCLPELLGRHGYESAFFQTSHPYFERWPQLVENFGFDSFFSMLDVDPERYDQLNYFGYQEEAMLPESRAWLIDRRADDRPFLATYMTLASHHPYEVPPGFDAGDLGPGARPDALPDALPDKDNYRRYLRTVRYTDGFVEKLFEQYRELGLYEETLFVIVSDHGEAFGEHGRRFHDNVPYQEGIRILAMLHDPDRPDAPDIDRNLSQIDLPPTVLDRLGFETTDGAYPGYRLGAIPAERTLRSQCFYERRCMTRIQGDRKFIYHFERRPPELYDLSEDPRERHNLADDPDHAGDLDRWRRDLLEWQRRVDAMHTQ